MSPTPELNADRLDSWKQIAGYLKRGVRTVRRWEHDEGLPIHRHVHRVLGSVYAYKSELDVWQRRERGRPSRSDSTGSAADAGAAWIRSIAVLPFVNLSADPENEYFADGLTDEITADLSKVRSLRVTSRTSSARFKGATKDARTIAIALGVRYLLEGSVRQAGSRLRITAQLIDADADTHLWAETYDGSVGDVFAIQEGIARLIVTALQVRLTDDEDRRLKERGITNVHAYECYLRARQQGWRWRKDAIDHAVLLLRNGLAIVGDNARLYAALGVAYLQYREAGIDFGEAPLAAADACGAQVFALEPASHAALLLRGWIHYSRAQIQEAVRDLASALALEPNDADTLLLLSNCYLISGRVAAARPLIERLVAVDPLTPLTRCMPAWAAILEGDFAAAVEPYSQMFAMDPGNPMGRLFYIWVLLLNGETESARQILDSMPADVRETVPARVAFFLVATKTGAPPPVLTPEIQAAASATDVFARFLATGYACAGSVDSAMHWLELAVERGFINHPFLARTDPSLERLRGELRFVRLMEVVHARWEQFET